MKKRPIIIQRPTLRRLEVEMKRMERAGKNLAHKSEDLAKRLEKRKSALKSYVAQLTNPEKAITAKPFVPPTTAEFIARTEDQIGRMEAWQKTETDPKKLQGIAASLEYFRSQLAFLKTKQAKEVAAMEAELKADPNYIGTVATYPVEPDTQGINMLPSLDLNDSAPKIVEIEATTTTQENQ